MSPGGVEVKSTVDTDVETHNHAGVIFRCWDEVLKCGSFSRAGGMHSNVFL